VLYRSRRVIRVTEVLKDWEDEPKFQDLLVYNPATDALEPTPALLNGQSLVLNTILKHTTGYKDYNHVFKDLLLRAWAKQTHVQLARDNTDLLEASYVFKANILFTNLFEELKPLDSERNEKLFKEEYSEKLKALLSSKVEEVEVS